MKVGDKVKVGTFEQVTAKLNFTDKQFIKEIVQEYQGRLFTIAEMSNCIVFTQPRDFFHINWLVPANEDSIIL